MTNAEKIKIITTFIAAKRQVEDMLEDEFSNVLYPRLIKDPNEENYRLCNENVDLRRAIDGGILKLIQRWQQLQREEG